ncbi:MAG: hypothetical protein B6229_03185 [Spirochaetaceae bacterium 4572_7]|nr:MAG: hypothetical protein B6229_03185 [Spirochaetaceae bacterium 4572_7]
MVPKIFALISMLLSAYSFIIFIRILLSWINLRGRNRGNIMSKITGYLNIITDPYLNWFKRFKFTQIGALDFSAMLAIALLYFVSAITSQIALARIITISFIIKLLISTIWSLTSSIILFAIIFIIVRIVFIYLNKPSGLFYSLDGYLEPFVRKFSNVFTKKFTSYKFNLIIFTISLFVAKYAIGFILSYLFRLF